MRVRACGCAGMRACLSASALASACLIRMCMCLRVRMYRACGCACALAKRCGSTACCLPSCTTLRAGATAGAFWVSRALAMHVGTLAPFPDQPAQPAHPACPHVHSVTLPRPRSLTCTQPPCPAPAPSRSLSHPAPPLPPPCAAAITDLQLVGGANVTQGRLEALVNGVWGSVCDDYFSDNPAAASVVCRWLGYSGGAPYPGATPFGPSSAPIVLDDVVCTGSEASLNSCSYLTTNNW